MMMEGKVKIYDEDIQQTDRQTVQYLRNDTVESGVFKKENTPP